MKERDIVRCVVFGDGLKRLRMTMAETARAAQVHERTVARWVHGERPIPGPMWVLFQRWMTSEPPWALSQAPTPSGAPEPALEPPEY
jgi:hypothetical protein